MTYAPRGGQTEKEQDLQILHAIRDRRKSGSRWVVAGFIVALALVAAFPIGVWNFNLVVGTRYLTTGLRRTHNGFFVVRDDGALITAERYLARAIAWRPQNAAAYHALADIAAARHQWQPALARLTEAHDLAPHDTVIAWDIALVNEQLLGATATAEGAQRQTMLHEWKAAGLSASTFVEQGRQALAVGDAASAVTWYRRAVEFDSQSGDGWLGLGEASTLR